MLKERDTEWYKDPTPENMLDACNSQINGLHGLRTGSGGYSLNKEAPQRHTKAIEDAAAIYRCLLGTDSPYDAELMAKAAELLTQASEAAQQIRGNDGKRTPKKLVLRAEQLADAAGRLAEEYPYPLQR